MILFCASPLSTYSLSYIITLEFFYQLFFLYFLNLSSIPFFYNLVTTRVNGEGIPDIIGNFPMNSPGSWICILSYWHLRKSRQWYCVVLRQLLNPLVPRVAYLLHKPLRSTNSIINVCFVFFPSVECLLHCKVIIRYRNIVIITFCGYLLFSRKWQPPCNMSGENITDVKIKL